MSAASAYHQESTSSAHSRRSGVDRVLGWGSDSARVPARMSTLDHLEVPRTASDRTRRI